MSLCLMELKKKIYNKIQYFANIEEPFIDLMENHYVIYRGIKAININDTISVYNATKEEFVEINNIDSLKIIYAFIGDHSFDLKKHISERWEMLNRELRSKRKIIKKLKAEQQPKEQEFMNQLKLF